MNKWRWVGFYITRNEPHRNHGCNACFNVLLCKKHQSEKFKAHTGYLNISSREATALDLVQYNRSCGYWNNVGTVLLELGDILEAKLLLDAAIKGKYEMPTIQRLGYLLETVGKAEKAECLHEHIESSKPQIILLTTEYAKVNATLNKKWRVLINDQVEIDE